MSDLFVFMHVCAHVMMRVCVCSRHMTGGGRAVCGQKSCVNIEVHAPEGREITIVIPQALKEQADKSKSVCE